MKFCVIRHPEITVLGTCPETAYAHQRALGWFRVSDWRSEPSDFHLPYFADALEDLDPDFDAEPSATENPTDSQPDVAEQTAPAPKSAANKKEKTA